MFFGNSFKKIKGKLDDYVLNKQLINSSLLIKTKDLKEIIGKEVIFAGDFLGDFFIVFSDESIFKIKTDGNLFFGKFDITKFEVNNFCIQNLLLLSD